LRPASLFALLIVFFYPTYALAQAAAEQTALQNLMDQVLAIVIPTFVTAIGLVATWLLLKLKQKLHIDVSEKTIDAWASLAQRAALRAAEWARNKAKDLAGDKKLPGGEIMEVAVNWALQMAEQQGLPALAREKLVGLIEAELFKLRQKDQLALAEVTNGDPGKLSIPTV